MILSKDDFFHLANAGLVKLRNSKQNSHLIIMSVVLQKIVIYFTSATFVTYFNSHRASTFRAKFIWHFKVYHLVNKGGAEYVVSE